MFRWDGVTSACAGATVLWGWYLAAWAIALLGGAAVAVLARQPDY